ncbi:hypothetical protein ACLOJK_007972 [Asimina triloba]
MLEMGLDARLNEKSFHKFTHFLHPRREFPTLPITEEFPHIQRTSALAASDFIIVVMSGFHGVAARTRKRIAEAKPLHRAAAQGGGDGKLEFTVPAHRRVIISARHLLCRKSENLCIRQPSPDPAQI